MIIIGPVTFHLYGLLIGLGILVGSLVASKVSKVKLDEVFDALVWVMVFGLAGARLYHVVDLWSYYSVHLNEIVMVWKGGMGIFGGILGGMVGGIRPLKIAKIMKSKGYSPLTAIKKSGYLKMLDVGAIGLPVGQAIGRWGNYFNQELYGKPTDLPWGIFIRPENRLLSVIEFERFHPLFLYESLWSVLGFLVVWGGIRPLNKKKLESKGHSPLAAMNRYQRGLRIGSGGVFLTYLGWYGLGRFFLEFLKIEAWMISGVNVAQVISVVLMGMVVVCWGRRCMK